MSYLDGSISSIHTAIVEKKVTVKELVEEALYRAHADNNNAFEYICDKEAMKEVEELDPNLISSPLYGIPYVLKDNFSTKDIPTTASSNILNGYVPVFSSEVAVRLKKAGAILIGKSTLDELAMGGTGTTGHKGISYNPWDKKHEHLIGGSSCGSAIAACTGIVPFAIGSDTGDSVRKPASFAGLVGFKPSWGRISRFGLFPFAPSLDHVGYFTRNVEDSALLLNALAGRDDKDSSSSFQAVEDYTKDWTSLKGKRVALIRQINDSVTEKAVCDAFSSLVKKMKEAGAVIETVDMPEDLLKAIYPTYIVISCAEATSNNANLDGIKFGPRYQGNDYMEVMTKARTAGFSNMIKRRFVIGSYALLKENQNELFLRAQKCRHMIVDAANRVLKDYDVMMAPAAPSAAPEIASSHNSNKLSNEYLIADNYLAIGNMAGLPSITLPMGFDNGMPLGVNLTGRAFKEKETLAIAGEVEKLTGYKGLMVKGE